jgi:hypothetical protein
MIGPAPDCLKCQHFNGDSDPRQPTCAAFEDGIPTEIYFGGKPHRNPTPGDGGIVFLPKLSAIPVPARFKKG